MTVKFIHERKVRSLAKKTLGSTRVGRAIRFPGVDWRSGAEDIFTASQRHSFAASQLHSFELGPGERQLIVDFVTKSSGC